ncbi:hypothetical protein NMK34_30810 [Micromonospora sp. BRA006-A]|uniref:ApeA N-terminal domain 1-containing protein n=1 Tax=Micromonospora sp. BRA006-A TaxID=2962860 RepID=UPI00296FE60F|nr:HEPN domain-containing protein [Micromonospora sp. BRA006-A]MDW3851005.1 hypothetical protein [Micromonospora sp. BRA006-A]
MSSNGETSASFPQVYSYATLRGELRNGLDVLLLDAQVISWHPDAAAIDARAALVGHWSDSGDPLTFDDIKLQVSGLDVISGVGPLKSFTFPTSGASFFNRSWTVEANPESEQSWSDSEAELKLSYDASLSIGDAYFYRMSFSPTLWIKLADRISLDECLKAWVEPIKRLVSLASGRSEQLTFLAVGIKSDDNRMPARERRLQVYGFGISQDPFASRGNEVSRTKPAFTTKWDDLSLLDLVRRWQSLVSDHHPLIETYGSSIVIPRQHPRAQYLLLIQALEGLHGYEHRSETERKAEEHSNKRRQVVQELESTASVSGPAMQFIKRFLAKRPFSSLDSCLRDLIGALPVDVSSDLLETALLRSVQNDPRRPQGVADSLRIIRNDLAHGTRGYPIQDLNEVSQILEQVARAHLLRVLGCGVDVQERAVNPDRH